MAEDKQKAEQENPIDPDKVTEEPGLIQYPHTVGSAIVKPDDMGKVKGRAVSAMHEQAEMQMGQLRKQMELLANQAMDIKRRVEISQDIYRMKINFEPLIGHIYHIYQKKSGEKLMSMVAPSEWGPSMPFESYIATVKMLSDHTWEIVEAADDQQ